MALETPILRSGYADTSSRRHPREPETVIVGDDEVRQSRFVGYAYISNYPNGRAAAFKVRGKKRYFFQADCWLHLTLTGDTSNV